ncbi:hypothetical protein DSO57_1011978 [Entomophthora muscae]|uniref:Uncharacterized protein n=1 Tax=Entomophthora muscae TaxID=34485 RepID=A0ACC2TH37_9FUNG|nr:hypothetical protein DSO57_1011978 [Entomophthora muscae]
MPAYFVPMTPPLTPEPDCPIETPAAANTTSTQLFGVLYITLTGMVDTIVPNSGPWSLFGQSHPFYGGHYPLAWPYSDPSQPMPLLMPGFLTQSILSYHSQLLYQFGAPSRDLPLIMPLLTKHLPVLGYYPSLTSSIVSLFQLKQLLPAN